jgi:hypothetical protein
MSIDDVCQVMPVAFFTPTYPHIINIVMSFSQVWMRHIRAYNDASLGAYFEIWVPESRRVVVSARHRVGDRSVLEVR